MRDFFKWLSGLSFIAFVVALVRQWGVTSERERQRKARQRREKQAKIIQRKVSRETQDLDASDITTRLQSLKRL